jgi:hypothetical protein
MCRRSCHSTIAGLAASSIPIAIFFHCAKCSFLKTNNMSCVLLQNKCLCGYLLLNMCRKTCTIVQMYLNLARSETTSLPIETETSRELKLHYPRFSTLVQDSEK